jgi:alcohol dehydrogenase
VREARADILVSVGGGSPIDAAKAIAFSLAADLDLSHPSGLAQARRVSLDGRSVLPHIAIPTTLSVAELSSSAGFTAEGSLEKVGVKAPEIMPTMVFYDAHLAQHTPLPLWLSTGIRAVDHAVEAIVSPGSHPYSDTLGLDGLRRLRAGLLASHANPSDVEARTQAQLGAWFSYALPIPSMTGLSHTLGKRIGSRHGIPHGVTSCLLLPHVMRYLAPGTAPAQARIAEALGADIRGCTVEQAAARAADAVADLVAQLDLPAHLSAYGITESDLDEAVRPVASGSHPAPALMDIFLAAM